MSFVHNVVACTGQFGRHGHSLSAGVGYLEVKVCAICCQVLHHILMRAPKVESIVVGKGVIARVVTGAKMSFVDQGEQSVPRWIVCYIDGRKQKGMQQASPML
ncbi:hypothetical protein WN943_019248 [Citrus x changshan-huyou]